MIRALLAALAVTMTLVLSAHATTLDEVRRLQREGYTSQALALVDRALGSAPSDPDLRFLRGVLLSEQGRYDEAESVFVALTREYPEMPEPHNNLGVLLSRRGEHQLARVELEEALRVNPNFAIAHENLGDIYVVLASAAYARAISLSPSSTTAPPKLALARALLDEAGRAAPRSPPTRREAS